MSDKNVRRVVGGLSAFAVAAGFAVTMGAGAASAAPGTISWNDGNSKFTRTVSNTTLNEGDIVTVSTKFERSGVVEYIYWVEDVHPACLTYVDGSAKVDGHARTLAASGSDFAKVEGSVVEWPVYPNINPNSRTFEFSYKVGAGCARDAALQTGMRYNGSLGKGTYTSKGPSITVNKNITSTTLGTVGGAQVGTATMLTATVTGGAQGDSVEFYDGASKIGSGVLAADGTATSPWTPSTKGDHTLQAKFVGTTRATGSQSATQNVTVAQQNQASTTSLAPVSGAQVGLASTLVASVSPAAAGGTVEFKDGSTVLASVAVDGLGKATYQWSPADAGNHTITATFSGRNSVSGSSTTAQVSVAAKPATNTDSTTTLTAITGAQVGKAQTLSAHVTGATTGTVTFKVGDAVVGTANIDGNGNASISWTPSAAGQFTVTAQYSGAGTVNASSDAASVIVAAADNGGGDNGGGTGSLGSLSGLFGSLSGK